MTQQPHPEGWRVGALALRSLVANAFRLPASIEESAGAVSSARGEGAPQPSQGCGAWNSAIGRIAEKGPQSGQR